MDYDTYGSTAVELAIELANTERVDPEWARVFLGAHEEWFTAGTSFDLSPGEIHRAAATAELVRSVALAESQADVLERLNELLALARPRPYATDHDGPLHLQVTCGTTTHSGGVHATLGAAGSPVVGTNDLSLTVASLPATGTTAYIFNARFAPGQTVTTVPNPAPAGGPAASGDICIAGGTFGRHVFGSDIYIGTSGTFTISVDLDDIPHPDGLGGYGVAAVAGETWYWQCWYRDQSAGVGASNFTEAIAITLQ